MLKRFIFRSLVLILMGMSAAIQAAAFNAAVRVDQVGYLPTETKYGMVAGAAPTGAFNVRRSSDNVSVLSGTLAAAFADADSGDSIRTADFSALVTPGTYYLDVAGVGASYNFSIAANAFQYAYTLSMLGFYGQRCGTAINEGTVDGVSYTHAICHASGAASDLPATYHTSSGKSGTKASAKGWHDAGDFGKYVVNSGISTGEMLWTWEWFNDRIGSIALAIPESGNGTPDVLNEARWNIEWMLTMQDADGGVWHKDTSAGFGSFTLPENDDAGTRFIIGSGTSPYKTSGATADFAAVMAIAARLYQPYDAAFAATCLAAAQNAWTWVSANPNLTFNNPGGISTGGYGDGNLADERLWAAAELFRTTGTALYNTYVTANTPGGILFNGANTQQDWGNVQNLALWTYYFSGQASANAALRTRIYNDTLTAANTIAARTNGATNGYKLSLASNQYIWGSNGAVANYGVFLIVADKMSPTAAYKNAALNDIHYLLGRNTFNTSFVTHLGSNPFLHPHHRPSGSPQYSAKLPWPGLLSGGPNSSSTDGSGLDALPSNPPARRWVDETGSYASNEIAINWNAPLVFLLAYTLPVPVLGTATISPTRSPSPSVTSTPTPLPCGPTTTLQRVNVGGPAFVDAGGNTWAADQAYAAGGWGYVAAGTTSGSATAVAGTVDDALYQAQRYAANLQYRFTVPNGAYTVKVKMAETYWTAAGQRVFNIFAEGLLEASNVDIFALAPGQNRALDLQFNVAVNDGVLNLDFTGVTDNASIAAIQVDQATSGPCATNTFSPSPSVTATASWTPTATLSRTSTSSPSATLTATPSATRSATATASPSASPSATGTVTGTPSPTVTLTRTPSSSPSTSPTGTPTATPTASPSVTLTATASRTQTASPSTTPTRTASPTQTASPSISPTSTDVPPGSTATSTPTQSPSVTLTLSYSLTPSPTATPTTTASSSPTASPSGTPTASPTDSPSTTATPSGTPTMTPTGSPTASLTLSVTPTQTPSDTPLPGASATFSVTVTPSVTGTPTTTGTPSATNTLSPSSTLSVTVTATLTATPTQANGGPTATPIPLDHGDPKVIHVVAVPQPVTGPIAWLRVELEGDADELQLRLYSKALTKVAVLSCPGSFGPGWNQAAFFLPELSTGTYYMQVLALRQGHASAPSRPGRLVLLR